VNGSQISGHHETVWNGKDDSGKDVSSGIYLYKLNAGNKDISTKKMILLK
jgi:flagellar hook assembly protein FlgD